MDREFTGVINEHLENFMRILLTTKCRAQCLVASLATALLIFTAGPSSPQEVHYLAITGEGTASVVVDDETNTAYITDGGRSGTLGIKAALVGNGQHVLDFLLDKKIVKLVITCSHPHEDHMGGLLDIIRNDPKLLQFESLYFVDSEYDHRGNKSLYQEYQEVHSSNQNAPKAVYVSAKGQDAFAKISNSKSSLHVSNFPYEAGLAGRSAHGNAVITRYALSSRESRTVVVDFDDASSKLIKQWTVTTPSTQEVNVLTLPHHGSRYNSLAPILSEHKLYGLQAAIIAVNSANRFYHPDPEVLLSLFETVGPQKVYITGSDLGNNISITPEGVTDHEHWEQRRGKLKGLVLGQLQRRRADLAQVSATIAKHSEGSVILPAAYPQAISESHIQIIERHGLLSRPQLKSLTRAREAIPLLEKALTYLGDDSGVLIATPSFSPTGPGPGSLPSPGNNPPLNPNKSGPSTYLEIARKVERETVPIYYPNSFEKRAANHLTEIRQLKPNWGGVILGSSPMSPLSKPVRLSYLTFPDPISADQYFLLVEIQLEDGSTVQYADMTPTELWIAHNLLQPSGDLLEQYGLSDSQATIATAVGLVGIAHPGAQKDVWHFGVHPIIARTSVARDAMRLDMFLATAKGMAIGKEVNRLPTGFRDLEWSNLQFHTYQWFDEHARIQKDSTGLLVVEPHSGPAETLMRVRLINSIAPAWATDAESEFNRRLKEAKAARDEIRRMFGKIEKRRADFEDLLSPPSHDQFRFPTLGPSKEERRLKQERQELEALGQEVRRQMERDFQKYVDENTRSDSDHMNRHLAAIYRSFDALQSVDRLARMLAVLNWYVLSTGQNLPELPSTVIPIREELPASWPTASVFLQELETPLVTVKEASAATLLITIVMVIWLVIRHRGKARLGSTDPRS